MPVRELAEGLAATEEEIAPVPIPVRLEVNVGQVSWLTAETGRGERGIEQIG